MMQAETDMFSFFARNTTSMTETFEMWLNANHTASEVPLHFKFSEARKYDCFGKQMLQLKVCSVVFACNASDGVSRRTCNVSVSIRVKIIKMPPWMVQKWLFREEKFRMFRFLCDCFTPERNSFA